ncbi:hypothetical protein DUI87_28809 [Hirundo rustica rustica]|uniref:Uncharacterized protein n=1 Tax=Hirundo rustica rustica TaxID=333673 RepID=A0A3M0J0X6_HIRRU|nr:hypothetical protein DUI87_28809 [Hirundo rustica rustica]
MEDHGGAEMHLQPMENPMSEQMDSHGPPRARECGPRSVGCVLLTVIPLDHETERYVQMPTLVVHKTFPTMYKDKMKLWSFDLGAGLCKDNKGKVLEK